MTETTMNQANVEAGRELDALIADRVLGLVPCDAWVVHSRNLSGPSFIQMPDKQCAHGGGCYPAGFPAAYSTNVAAAWQVVEKLREQFYVEITDGIPSRPRRHEWKVTLVPLDPESELPLWFQRATCVGKSLPLTLCRTALLVIGVDVPATVAASTDV